MAQKLNATELMGLIGPETSELLDAKFGLTDGVQRTAADAVRTVTGRTLSPAGANTKIQLCLRLLRLRLELSRFFEDATGEYNIPPACLLDEFRLALRVGSDILPSREELGQSFPAVASLYNITEKESAVASRFLFRLTEKTFSSTGKPLYSFSKLSSELRRLAQLFADTRRHSIR